jgi:hypothetical protein
MIDLCAGIAALRFRRRNPSVVPSAVLPVVKIFVRAGIAVFIFPAGGGIVQNPKPIRPRIRSGLIFAIGFP